MGGNEKLRPVWKKTLKDGVSVVKNAAFYRDFP